LIYIRYKIVQFVGVCYIAEPTYGHKPHDFIANVNQWILA